MVSQSLDRGVCDKNWTLTFSKATMKHLIQCQFNRNNPFLLRCKNSMSSIKGRPCRFQATWCMHLNYSSLVHLAWVKELGNRSFRNIFSKKKLEAHLRSMNTRDGGLT
ncbi:hypothetical protein CR513_63089, partial [Mucuna pruriens]